MKLIETILDFIFPTKCGICNKIGKEYICENCYKEIKKYMYINTNSDIFYMLKYKEIVRDRMIAFKFNDNPYLYHMFCDIFVKNKIGCDFVKKYDIIIPIPMHKNKKTKRGYNQSELFAKGISKALKIPVSVNSLIKQRDTLMQSSLGKNERTKNVQNAYEIKNMEKINNKNILLVDDIYTTGATINECKRIIMRAGATKVGVLIIAKD